jgi:hypothetical protein
MAKLQYVGPHDAVIVPMPLGGEKLVERNGELSTSDAHAAGLLEQPANWKKISEPKGGKA